MSSSNISSRVVTGLAIAILLFARPCSAEDTAVQLIERQQGDDVVVSAKLTNALDVTMTLSGEVLNMRPSAALPITVDSEGKSEVPLVTLHIVDRSKPSHNSCRLAWKPGGRERTPPKPYAYALPYKDGPHRVLQGFFGKFSHSAGSQDEYAVDWAMPIGAKVCAARAGIVVAFRADVQVGGPDPRFKQDYNYIVIRHDDGTYAEYLHLDADGVSVHLGDRVSAGQVIGISGETGYTSEPHLHFAVFNTLSGQGRKTIPVEFLLKSGKHITPQVGRSL